MPAGKKELLMLFDEVEEGLYFTDRQRRITFWNRAAERISGYSRAEVLGRRCFENILIHVDGRGRSMCTGLCPLARTLRDGKTRRSSIYLHHKDGHRVPVQVRVFPLRDEKRREIGAAELFMDISATPALEARLQHLEKMAMNDRLTGIANRRYCETYLQARLEEFKRFRWPLGVIFFDIDDFKSLNDRHSHRVGDRALKTVARTLKHNIRSIDQVGRWGGEEFIVILRNADKRNMQRIAEKLRLLVERSVFWVQGTAIGVTLSGGATLARPGDTRTSLVERADLLMYKGKKAGKNRVVCS
jgi:diguanylate cyclase (GGDEF)-like protein/PAS domain S-box-containing protein